MAAEVSTMPVNGNGNYAPHQGYGAIEQNNGAFAANAATSQSSYGQAPTTSTSATSNSTTSEIPKDEVGWYFVEQYYTTLSRSPEKLYLFYNKRSQFVSGQETDKVAVCVGQRAINDRIKELDFQDCKVRVTNVDSQASDANIVIQVIGEISNKSQPHKKFTQTFVLATQTNGYFVLNDIFRYIIEEEDELEAAAPETEEVRQASSAVLPTGGHQEHNHTPAIADEVEPKTLTSSMDTVAIEQDAGKVDQELEESVLKDLPTSEETAPQVEPTVVTNGVAAEEEAHEEEAPAAIAAQAEKAEEPEAVPEPVVEEPVQLEKPKDPEPTPAVSPPKQTPVQPAAPSKPSAPKTWANLAAAANRVATPVTPTAPAAASAQQQRPAPPSQTSSTPAPSGPSVPAVSTPAARDESPPASQQDEWTSVGDHKRQQSRQATGPEQHGPQHRGYVKNVHEGIDAAELRKVMEKYGELQYFDVARQKNCAFVDWKSPDGYAAAVKANPHQMGEDRLYVEERRLKPGAYPYVQRGGMRGGRGGPGQAPPRGGFQGRGGYNPRGRGGSAPQRGARGSPQAS